MSGFLSDRFGSRGIATAGMAVFGGSFVGLMLLPVNFPYWAFAVLIAANGIGSGMFAAPNSSSIMGSVPARQRGAASGMRSTFQNSGTALSIGIFFSLMIAGLASSLPATLTAGLQRQGVPHAIAHQIGVLPPVSSLFASVLGVNPVQHLLASADALASLPAASQHILTGQEFFPDLISAPFHQGLTVVFAVATGLSVLAALASLLRGTRPDGPANGRPSSPAAALARPGVTAPGSTSGPTVTASEPGVTASGLTVTAPGPAPGPTVTASAPGVAASAPGVAASGPAPGPTVTDRKRNFQ